MNKQTISSLQEYMRGIAGGLIMSLPLLYTMEVWWAGFLLSPWKIAIYLVAGFGLLLLYNRFAGLRADSGWLEVAIDSVEELGLGIVISAIMLWAVGQIDGSHGLKEILGKISVEAVTVAIGVSVGTAQLGMSEQGGVAGETMEDHEVRPVGQMAIALCGAVLLASNIAPTDEVLLIASSASSLNLMVLMLMSLLLSWLLLYCSNFRGSDLHVARGGWTVTASGVLMTYAVALIAAAGLLFFFNRFDGEGSTLILAQIVVLGLPAVLGAAVGRLLLQ